MWSSKASDWLKLETRLLSKLNTYSFWLDADGLININIKINLPIGYMIQLVAIRIRLEGVFSRAFCVI